MLDEEIVALFWQRDEKAIEETSQKYGKALSLMALRILSDQEDASECVNDTYWKAWNTIPPTRPIHLSSYLYKLLRHISIDRFRARRSGKRVANEYTASLEELSECLAGEETPDAALEMQFLSQTIQAFVQQLPKQQRQMFVCRYYFLDPIGKIADYFSVSQSKVKSTLYRVRCSLKQYLQQEGFFL